MTDERFTPGLVSAVQASHKKFWPYGPFVSVTLAQWALESNWGKRQAGKNNYFGIKANEEQIAEGSFSVVWTKEFLKGQYVSIEDKFADYVDLEGGIDAHAELLVGRHYLACMDAQSPEEYAQALKTCGYATAPNYAGVLIQIIKENELKKFDQVFDLKVKVS